MLSRREFIKSTSILVTSTVSLPLLSQERMKGTGKGAVRFGLATDSHYADREPKGTRYFRQSIEKMAEFVDVLNQEKVDFAVHLGDFKDEDQSKKTEDTLRYLTEIESQYAKFDGPRYHCIGNHDVDSITKRQFQQNIENTGVPVEQTYFSFDVGGYHFVVLDPNFHEDGRDHNMGDFSWYDAHLLSDQLAWLADDLASTDLPTVVFCHFALFECTKGDAVFHVENYKQVQEVFEASKKVLAVFQGHVHEERFQEINGIHYVTQNGMVDYEGLANNSFAIIDISAGEIKINGYKRTADRSLLL